MDNSQNIFQSIPDVKVEKVFNSAKEQNAFYSNFSKEMKEKLNRNEAARQESEQKARSLFVG